MEIIIGLIAYLLYFIYDYNTIHKNRKFIKPFFLIGTLLLGVSTVYTTVKYFDNDSLLSIILFSLSSLIFLTLLIYTLFFAIPFNETYIKDSEERLAYTKGVYGVCRHPGMLWFAGLYLSLWGLTNKADSGLFYLLMIIGDLLYIIYQDVYIFPKTFSNYDEYKITTPFLISFTKRKELTTKELIRKNNKRYLWNKYCSFLELSIDDYMDIQNELILEQISLWKESKLGKSILNNVDINSIDEFRNKVKLTAYDDYADILLKKENYSLPINSEIWIQTTWEGGTKPIKVAPYSRGMLDVFKDNIVSCLILSSSTKKYKFKFKHNDKMLYGLAPLPFLTGLVPYSLSEATDVKILPPVEKAQNMSFSKRNALGFKMAMQEDVELFFGLGSVAHAVTKALTERKGKASVKSLLKYKPKMLARLIKAKKRCDKENRDLLPKDLFNLKCFMIAGTDNKCYKDDLEKSWGIRPLELFAGTEMSLIGTETWNRNGLYFFPKTCFYEFIKLDDVIANKIQGIDITKTYLLDEVEEGIKYELVISTLNGGAFMRYRTGDIYCCVGLKDLDNNINLPRFEYVDRIPWIIDIAGFSRFNEKELSNVIKESNIDVNDWYATKSLTDNGKPILHLYLEINNEYNEEDVISNLDEVFTKTDEDYDGLKKILGTNPLKVTFLKEKTINEYRVTHKNFMRVDSFNEIK